MAGREFEIGTDSFGVKDFGFNDGDEDEVIVLGDDDDNDGSVSDIFDISDDPPNDDGYCDDGQGDEDTYSVFSPKPCTITDNELELDEDIEVEDTPPITNIEETVGDASVEASKKDGRMIEECSELVESLVDDGLTMRGLDEYMDGERFRAAKFWKEQIQRYESKMIVMFKKMTRYADGIRAAKRRMDYDAYEISRLRDLVITKTKEANDKDAKVYKFAKEANDLR